MRLAIVGVLLIAAAAAVGGVLSGQVEVGRGSGSPQAEGHLFALVVGQDDRATQFVLVDPRMRSMAAYQLNRETCELSLKSVRCFNWDLQMLHYNSGKPLPEEIRSMLEGR